MFKDIFESSPLALILVDIQGKMKFVNREAQILFGYTLSEMEGQPIEILVPQEIRGHHPNLRADFFRAPSSRSMGRGRNLFGKKRVAVVAPPSPGFHLAFHAKTKEDVHSFHREALSFGGKDNGAPGPRPEYGPRYYAAFVIDPDGYEIEVKLFAENA